MKDKNLPDDNNLRSLEQLLKEVNQIIEQLEKEKDLENTLYTFILDDGKEIQLAGNEEVEYDGEIHTAANLFDALKEGYYGKF